MRCSLFVIGVCCLVFIVVRLLLVGVACWFFVRCPLSVFVACCLLCVVGGLLFVGSLSVVGWSSLFVVCWLLLLCSSFVVVRC